MDNSLLYSKLAELPENIKSQVADFIGFLIMKEKDQEKPKPQFGSGKGMFVMTQDFDEPLDDFKDYMF